MSKKQKSEETPEIGHNSAMRESLTSYVGRISGKMDEMEQLNGEIKAIRNDAKASGFLKTALTKAIKDLRLTAEQKQAADEVQNAREEYVRICREEGLFVPEEEAA